MKEDIVQIKSSPDVFTFADKTNNIYQTSPQEYQKLLFNNVTKSYQKSTERLEKAINIEAKQISKKLDLDNRLECLGKNPEFSTNQTSNQHYHVDLSIRLKVCHF